MIIVLKRQINRWHSSPVSPRTGRAWPHEYRLYDTDTGLITTANSRHQRRGYWGLGWGGLKGLLDQRWTAISPPGDIRLPEGL